MWKGLFKRAHSVKQHDGMSKNQVSLAKKLALEFKEINDQTHPMLLKLSSSLKDSLARLLLQPLSPLLGVQLKYRLVDVP